MIPPLYIQFEASVNRPLSPLFVRGTEEVAGSLQLHRLLGLGWTLLGPLQVGSEVRTGVNSLLVRFGERSK